MFWNQLLDLSWWGLALQLASAVIITGFVVVALVSLSTDGGVTRARLLVAEGVIGGLGVMTAATLLRMIGLRGWHQILMFTLILLLRVLLKKLFVWEKHRLFRNPAHTDMPDFSLSSGTRNLSDSSESDGQ